MGIDKLMMVGSQLSKLAQPIRPQQGSAADKLFKIGTAALTGGAAGAGMAVAGMGSGPAAGLAGAAQGIGNLGIGAAPKDGSGIPETSSVPSVEDNFKMPINQLGAMSSMNDQMSSPTDHREILRQGLAGLGHPDVPQHLRDEYAEPMLTAYHFGGPRPDYNEGES